MASSDEQLHKDIEFGTTARNAGVTATIEIRLYDNAPHWGIDSTPRNNREEVLADVVRTMDLLEQQSAERKHDRG